MSGPKDQETIATAQDLTAALNAMAGEVKQLRTYGKRNRKFIVFDIALTVALAVVSFVAVHAGQSARSAEASAAAAKAVASVAQQNNRNLCLSNNVARSQQTELWTFVINLSRGKPQTAQQKKNVAAFRHELQVIYAPRNCSHVSPGNPGPTP